MKSDLPAFPTWNVVDITKGMTLRDYFATSAMQGFCTNSDYDGIDHKDLATWSYEVADAMMEARQ